MYSNASNACKPSKYPAIAVKNASPVGQSQFLIGPECGSSDPRTPPAKEVTEVTDSPEKLPQLPQLPLSETTGGESSPSSKPSEPSKCGDAR